MSTFGSNSHPYQPQTSNSSSTFLPGASILVQTAIWLPWYKGNYALYSPNNIKSLCHSPCLLLSAPAVLLTASCGWPCFGGRPLGSPEEDSFPNLEPPRLSMTFQRQGWGGSEVKWGSDRRRKRKLLYRYCRGSQLHLIDYFMALPDRTSLERPVDRSIWQNIIAL